MTRKIGIALFPLLALGTILWIATLWIATLWIATPFAQNEAEENRIMAKVAVFNDAPRVTIKGRIINPDGNAINPDEIEADRVWLFCKTLTIIQKPPTFPGGTPSYYPSYGRHSTGPDKEGKFESSDIRAGAYVLIYAQTSAHSSFRPQKLVSLPIFFRADRDREDITIQLQEGIRIYGSAMFDDGIPLNKGRTIVGIRSMTPPDLMKVRNIAGNSSNFTLNFQTPVQADGKYELYLPPGDFQITESGDSCCAHAVSVAIKDTEKDKDAPKEYRIDLTFPAPLRGKFVKEDGSAPGKLKVTYAAQTANSTNSSSFDMRAEDEGEFSLNKMTGSFLIAMTEDKSLGIIYPIPDEKLSEYHTVVLKPAATVQLALRDSIGQPVAGMNITASVGNRIQFSSSTTYVGKLMTDNNGVAEFPLPPGTGYYMFSWNGGEYECEKTLEPGETVVIPAVVTEHHRL